MKYAFAIVAAAGLAAAAQAQSTRLVFEASNDAGATWTSNLTAAPGQNIQVRVRAEYVQGAGGTQMGLAGLTFQPTVSNWTAGDTVAALSADGAGVAAASSEFGRILPFAAAGQGSASASGVLTSFVDGGNTLRFAGSKNTTATTNPAWGVAIGQNPQSLANPPESYSNSSNPLIFRFGFTLGSDTTARDLVASVPLSSIVSARGRWYTSALGTALNAAITAADITPATISIVPAPASLALLGLGGLVAGRRRR